MERAEITDVLVEAKRSVGAGSGLAGTGFWPMVAAVKKDAGLVEEFGSEIASIDQDAFWGWALLIVPLRVGTSLMILGTGAGLFLIGWAYPLDGASSVLAFLAGFGILTITTHGLAHLTVGRLVGIRFTAWYIGSVVRPQPGVKIDYRSYLRAPARSRALMHASGALMTKALPFLLIGAAVGAGLGVWVIWLLVLVGVATIATDALWSTQKSDWARYRREMELA